MTPTFSRYYPVYEVKLTRRNYPYLSNSYLVLSGEINGKNVIVVYDTSLQSGYNLLKILDDSKSTDYDKKIFFLNQYF